MPLGNALPASLPKGVKVTIDTTNATGDRTVSLKKPNCEVVCEWTAYIIINNTRGPAYGYSGKDGIKPVSMKMDLSHKKTLIGVATGMVGMKIGQVNTITMTPENAHVATPKKPLQGIAPSVGFSERVYSGQAVEWVVKLIRFADQVNINEAEGMAK